jgi:hypothetical protein
MIEERLEMPFEVQILGSPAKVERIDVIDDQIVAICRSGRSRQAIPILELPLPDSRPRGGGVDRSVPPLDARRVTDSSRSLPPAFEP